MLSLGVLKIAEPNQQHLLLSNGGYVDEGDLEFFKFIAKFGKQYATAEEFEHRKNCFKENWQKVQNFKTEHFRVAINPYSDLAENEWKAMIGAGSRKVLRYDDCNTETLPKGPVSVDWRNQGAITAVKDMKVDKCNNPWAFAASGAVEFLYW